MEVSTNTPFPSPENFLGPLLNKDGKPLGPQKFKELVRERYWISKNINTSYGDTGQLTPIEREYLLEFITDEMKKQKDFVDKQLKKR